MRLLRLQLALVLVVSACTGLTQPAPGTVQVALTSPGLVATNRTSADAYYFVVERQAAALINWAPCTDPGRCSRVAVEGSTTVPYEQIYGWPGSGQVIFYWWHLVPSTGGDFRPDSIRAVIGTR